MKKILLGMVLFSSLGLVACGNNSDNSSKASETKESTLVKTETKESSKQEDSGDFVGKTEKSTFDGTTLKTNPFAIKITKHQVIQPGETGNEYSDKPVIAIWYDTTVNPDYDGETAIDPGLAWIAVFTAVQDNDPNAVNTLNVASLPDMQYIDSQNQEIKPGGTVSNAIAYTLDGTTTPVTLIAKNSMGKEIDKTTINLN